MQEENFHGNEVALSVACNAFEDVVEGNNRALFISGAQGVGKSALIKRLRTKLSSNDMLDRYSFLAGRQLEQGFIHFVDINGIPNLPQDGHAVIIIDEIQDFNDHQLNDIREAARSLASSRLHFLLVLSYTNGGVKNQSTLMLPTIAEIKSMLSKASVAFDDIEVKPMTLADIATTIAFTMSPNNFPSNLVNKLYALTGGVQLFLRETIAYLRESGALTVDGGKWLLDIDHSASAILDNPITIENLEALRIDRLAERVDTSADTSTSPSDDLVTTLLQLCRNLVKHHIVDEPAAAKLIKIASVVASNIDDVAVKQNILDILPGGDNETEPSRPVSLLVHADNIAHAEEILAPLAQKYKMSQVLQNAQYMLDILPESDFHGRRIALKYKCDAQMFLGMYQDAYETASLLYTSASKNDDSRTIHEALYRQGYAAGSLQDFETSDRCLDEALETASRLDDNAAARLYACIHASLYNDHPDHAKALRLANYAYESAERDSDLKIEAQALVVMSHAHKSLFDLDRAKVEAMLALKIVQDIDDPRIEGRAHMTLAAYHQSNHEKDKALEHYLIAEQLLLQINDMPGLASIHLNIGNLLCDSSSYDEAIKHFEDALSAVKGLNILSKMLIAHLGLASANIYKGNVAQAEKYLTEAMNIANQLGSNWALAYANSSFGEYYQQIGECEEALAYYRQSLEIDRRNNDLINAYCDLINIASMCSYTDRIDEGIQTLQEAQEMPVERIKESMAGNVNNTFAGLYYAKEDYEMALLHYQKALDEDIKSNHRINTAISYGNISGTYFALGEYEKAVEMADKAIEIDRELNDNLQLANHLARQAANYQAQGKLAESRDLHLEAARMFRRLNILDDEAMMLQNAAANMHDLYDSAGAKRTLHDALSALEETGNYELQPNVIKLLALLASEDEYFDEAISLYKKAAAIYTEHDVERDEIYGDIYQSLAEIHLSLGQNEEAISCYNHLADTFAEDNPDFSVENRILAGKTYMQMPDNQSTDKQRDAAKEFDMAFEMLEKMKDDDLRAAATSDIGDYLYWRKMADEGYAFKTKAINAIKDSTQNKQLLARLYYTLAERLLEQKYPDKAREEKKFNDALENYFAALRICQDSNDYWQQGFVCNNIGYTFDTMGQLYKASQFYHRAYTCYKEANDLDGMYNNLNNEALMLDKIGRKNDAAACYRSALDLLQKESADPVEIANTAFNIAKCLMDTDSDDAVKYFNLAYTNYKDSDMLDEMISCLDVLAMHYVNKKNISSAASCISIAQTLLNSKHAYDAQAKINNLIGCIYTYIAQPTNAIESFYKSIRIFAEHDQWGAMAHCHFLMATKLMHDEQRLNDIITVKGKSRKISDFCMECLDFAVKTAEKEGETALQSDSLSTRSLLHWNNQNYDLFDSDIQKAISIATTDESKLSLMLHNAVLLLMQKEYDRAEQKFIETYGEAVSKSMFEEQLTTKAWLCYLYFEKGDLRNALIILNEINPNIEYAVAKVPGLAVHLARR